MLQRIFMMAALLLLAFSSRTMAFDSCRTLGKDLRCSRCAALPCCCPDNYCAKPMPCVEVPCPSCCPDNYCAKPMPCVQVPGPSCCPDNYCAKPLPNFCLPIDCQYYRCSPGGKPIP